MKYFISLISIFICINYCLAQEKEPLSKEKKEALVFPTVLEKASKENKSILLIFSGKDWCEPCQELEKTILSTKLFLEFAKKNIVFLDLDYPQSGTGPSPENNQLAERYGIDSYPSIFIADEKGMPYQKISFTKQTVELFITSIESALKRRVLKSKFVTSKDEEEKKKLAGEFLATRTEGENYIFYAELIAFGVIQNKELKAEEKIKQLGDLYINSDDPIFVEKLGLEIKKIDPEKKMGSARLFAIKEFISLLIAQNDEKAFEYFTVNKLLFKGDDLGYIYEFAMHLNQKGNVDKAIQIVTYILTDENIKKNPDAVKGLTEQLNELKAELNKVKPEKSSVDINLTLKDNVVPPIKADEVKPMQKEEDKPKEKEQEIPAPKAETNELKKQ